MKTITVTLWPDRPITVSDAEAAALTVMGIVLTIDGAATNAVVAGTPVYRGGTP